MKVRFWGVRGSFAMPGDAYLRYGGNTTAVEVRNDSGQRLLIDFGTGVTEFAKELMGAEFGKGEGHLPVLLSHTHLDHIQGLPFFTPLFIKGNHLDILGNAPEGTSLKQVLQDQLNPHYSPLYGLENLAAGVNIESVEGGSSLPVEGFEVSAEKVPHGAITSMAFRITADGKTVVFLSDVEYPESGPSAEVLALAKGADLLIHDGMISDEEYPQRQGWGHSPIGAGVDVAERCDVARLAVFHHSPDSTDEIIDEMVGAAQAKTSVDVFAAAEGPALDI